MTQLVLTRGVGETVVIGDPQQPLGRVTVVRINGNRVRLAFEFPRETLIAREELLPAVVEGKSK